jgi:hypothetical protein
MIHLKTKYPAPRGLLCLCRVLPMGITEGNPIYWAKARIHHNHVIPGMNAGAI